MKKISVIIPIYNTVGYLRKCLESICMQSYKNLEIIGVDDGSTDGSGAILDQFASQDKRIIAIHKSNRGESSARNIGLQVSTGEYIAFVDCDDWIERDMYLSLVTLLEKYNADLALSSYYLDDENNSHLMENVLKIESPVWDRKSLLEYVYKRDYYRGVTSYIWSKLFRKKCLIANDNKLILFDEEVKHGGDLLFFARVVMNIERAAYSEKAFYHYVQRQESTTHSQNISLWLEAVQTYVKLISFYQQYEETAHILIWIKRFLVYRAQLVAELAYKQKDIAALAYCEKYMDLYEQEYLVTNKKFPDRIKKYKEIKNYHI